MSTRTRVRNYLKKERIHYWRKVNHDRVVRPMTIV